jgi:Ni,Fe-hydrogenase III small subunit
MRRTQILFRPPLTERALAPGDAGPGDLAVEVDRAACRRLGLRAGSCAVAGGVSEVLPVDPQIPGRAPAWLEAPEATAPAAATLAWQDWSRST